jgi:FAD/FMN-containing dehydrogenase
MIDHLIADLNAARVDFTTDTDIIAGHTVDWTGRFTGHADVLARPRNSGEVQMTLRAASANGAYVTVQGGNTGLVGGSVPPTHPDRPVLILNTTRLDQLGPVDVAARTMTAGAGATLAAVQRHAAASGLLYGVDLAARDSATIGGTVATNAGGIRVCGYGMTRAQVVGVEAALSDGTRISRMVGLPKDNTGYDLPGLLTGSEGTLAVITEVMVRLQDPRLESVVMLLPAADLATALNMIRECVPTEATLLGAEVVDAATLDLVCESGGLPQPFGTSVDSAYVLLLEATDINPPRDLQAHAIAAIDAVDQRRLWSYREGASEAASTLGVVHKLDISVPLHQLDALVIGVQALIPEHATLLVFGHLADGNLHFEIAGVDPSDAALDDAILKLATSLGGAVSAEHGVGRAKAAALPLSRTAGDIEVMRRLKHALDPTGTLNPGVLLPHQPSPAPHVAD